MALDYYMEIENRENKLTTEDIARTLASTFGLKVGEGTPIMIGAHTSVSVFARTDEFDESRFGSPHPDVCVAFRLDKFSPDDKSAEEMLRMVRWLLDWIKYRAVLVDSDGEIFLQKEPGGLFVNTSQEFWTKSRLSIIFS